MKDAPIIFSGPMVRALLDGRKTMTRRLVPYGSKWMRVLPRDRLWVRETWQLHSLATDLATVAYRASIGGSWTEAHEQFPAEFAGKLAPKPFQEGWRSPIHIPRAFSRLTLVVTATKIERLNDISEEDAIAEGIARIGAEYIARGSTAWDRGPNFYTVDIDGASLNQPTAKETFSLLWRWLHGEESWDENPEVVALTFTVHKQNIDALPRAEAA